MGQTLEDFGSVWDSAAEQDRLVAVTFQKARRESWRAFFMHWSSMFRRGRRG